MTKWRDATRRNLTLKYGKAAMTHLTCSLAMLLCATITFAADDPADDLAKTILQKAGIHVGVCELPRAGDGTLAAALARTGIAQVHGLTPDAAAAEAARRPAAACGALGSQVVIETGNPSASLLGDWVADLLVIADATDANLKDVPPAEVRRVVSPYRGVAVVGNPRGGNGGLASTSLMSWAKETGGTVKINEDAGGLWAIIKAPPLKGGDDWTHVNHGSDGNPVSDDTAIRRGTFSLQCYDKPREVDKWGTVVAAAGRVFYLPGSFDHIEPYSNEVVVRNMYNGQILWRRSLEFPFGRNDSLIIATAERVYLKYKNNVLVLNPETGEEMARIMATDERSSVRWLLLNSGTLVTLIGDPQHAIHEVYGGPPGMSARDRQNSHANDEIRNFVGRELAGWDARTGKRLWTFAAERIDPAKLAARNGRLFLYANNSYATCIDVRTGKQIWKTLAPITNPIRPFNIDWEINNIITQRQQALVSEDIYLIASPAHGQTQAFSPGNGQLLWQLGAGYPWREDGKPWMPAGLPKDRNWGRLTYPLVLDGIVLNGSGGAESLDPLTGKPSPRKLHAARQMAGCGHETGTSGGLLMAQGGAVYDSTDGQQLTGNFMKNGCGSGGGVIADGVTIKMSHGCGCPEWKGYVTTRTAVPRAEPPAARLERGAATLPAAAKMEAGDWATYLANPLRSGSTPAVIPEKAAIRWTYLPSRSDRRPVGNGAVSEYEPDGNATQAITVGDRIWFGAAEGALVCLDRQTGAERWRYWTAGRIMSPPTWYDGRLYAGSCDGWVYCLDAANGALIWRYRVAPAERRLMVQGYLSSAWPVLANVLVHDDTVFASAGLISALDGSVFCALDARTGEPRWEKRWQNQIPEDTKNGAARNVTPDAKADQSKDLPCIPQANGQMAWYGGRILFKAGWSGLYICNPVSGEMRTAFDFSNVHSQEQEWAYRAAWKHTCGQDIGVLPGGWIVAGGRQFFYPYSVLIQSTSGPLLLNATGFADPAGKDAKGYPPSLSVTREGGWGGIPVWDASETLVDFGDKNGFQLCRDFSAALTADVAAHVDDPKPVKPFSAWRNIKHYTKLPLSAEQCRPVLPDHLLKKSKWEKCAVESPVLAANAVVYVHGSSVAAVARAERKLLWDVAMPCQPLPGGLSITKSGEVLVPLVDGRLACIGSGEPMPFPAESAREQQAGLIVQSYDFSPFRPDRPFQGVLLEWDNVTRIPAAEELAGLKPTATILSSFSALNQDCVRPTVVRLSGFVDVPETATYQFSVKDDRTQVRTTRVTIYDATRRFVDYTTGNRGQPLPPSPLLLAKGKHPIEIIALQYSGSLRMELNWEIAGRKPTPVPAEALWHDPLEKPAAQKQGE